MCLLPRSYKRATENNKPHPTGLTILKYLGLKFSEPTVQDLFPFYKNLSALTKMSIEDKLEVLEKLVTKIRHSTDDKEDEMVAFLLLGFSPELHNSCIPYLGRNRSLTIKDVLSLSTSEKTDTAMCQKLKHCSTFLIYNDVHYHISSVVIFQKRKGKQTEMTEAPVKCRSQERDYITREREEEEDQRERTSYIDYCCREFDSRREQNRDSTG